MKNNMSFSNKYCPVVTAASAALLGISSAQAQTVGLSAPTLYAVTDQSIGTYADASLGNGNIGIYSFTVTSSSAPGTTGLADGQTIYSICLSPEGHIGSAGLYNY